MENSLHMDSATRLSSFNIPHLDLVLDEFFNIPPPWLTPHTPRPETLRDMVNATGEDLSTVIHRMRVVVSMNEGIEITVQDLQMLLQDTAAVPPLLIDVREAWEYAICHLAGSILLTNTNFAELLPRLRAAAKVVTICHAGVRSYSAAMYLRQQGVTNAVSLTGGVEAWALEIDTQMARY